MQQERQKEQGKLVEFGGQGGYDDDIYGGSNKKSYVSSIPTGDTLEDMTDEEIIRRSSYTAPKLVYDDVLRAGDEESNILDERRASRVSDRDDGYRSRRLNRDVSSPTRRDPLDKNQSEKDTRGYREIMMEQKILKEEKEVKEAVKKKLEEEEKDNQNGDETPRRKKRRWDDPGDTPIRNQPDNDGQPPRKRNRWDETPVNVGPAGSETPGKARTRSRWDETPVNMIGGNQTPLLSQTASTPLGNLGQQTPLFSGPPGSMTPDLIHASRWAAEINERNKPWTDEELNEYFPKSGYEIVPPPPGYEQQVTHKYTATPTPYGDHGFRIQEEQRIDLGVSLLETPGDLPNMKPEDEIFFKDLLLPEDESLLLDPEKQKERKIKKLLLKVKNGTPAQRKQALRQITDKAREFGPGPLFNLILPLLMTATLEDQERHLLVKVIDRILYKLDDLVRPYVHKILVVIEPLLIDEDYYARIEGREIISNLAKAAGLVTMITTMRPDIDDTDEYVRNTTARAFSVVASALGFYFSFYFSQF